MKNAARARADESATRLSVTVCPQSTFANGCDSYRENENRQNNRTEISPPRPAPRPPCPCPSLLLVLLFFLLVLFRLLGLGLLLLLEPLVLDLVVHEFVQRDDASHERRAIDGQMVVVRLHEHRLDQRILIQVRHQVKYGLAVVQDLIVRRDLFGDDRFRIAFISARPTSQVQ